MSNPKPNNFFGKTRQIIIQPSSLCNLNCAYCYLSPENRKVKAKAPQEVTNKIIDLICNYDNYEPEVELLWHAGEPLSVGIPYYNYFFDELEKKNVKNICFVPRIQTNCTLITQKYCDFFLKHGIKIGVSIDGPEFIHDANRVDWSNQGSFRKAMAGIRLLKQNNVEFGAIAVLTKESLKFPDEIFNFFKEHEFPGVGFNIEEVEFANTRSSIDLELSQTYTNFISRLFDLWKSNNSDYPQIREFEGLVSEIRAFIMTNSDFHSVPDETVGMRILTFSKDGDIITFAPELAEGTKIEPRKFVIANVSEIEHLSEIPRYSSFEKLNSQIQESVSICKRSCELYSLCGGRYIPNKFYENGSFSKVDTIACYFHEKLMTSVVLEKLKAL